MASSPRRVCADGPSASPHVSIIIPARNEGRWLAATLNAALAAIEEFTASRGHTAELIVVDNQSTDNTWAVITSLDPAAPVVAVRHSAPGAARARNSGRRQARGQILIFVDADTHVPRDAVTRIAQWCDQSGKQAGITRLAGLEGGCRAWLWWTFWEHVRRLPLPRAKAMPALMFCTASVFDEFGPFDESVAIGEEWPILAGLYRARPGAFVYDRTLTAWSSNRRMERQRLGYLRTFCKYVWAVLHLRGRIHFTDHIR